MSKSESRVEHLDEELIKILIIPEQESTLEVNNIFCRMLTKLCCANGLMSKVVEILKDLGIQYEIKEEGNIP